MDELLDTIAQHSLAALALFEPKGTDMAKCPEPARTPDERDEHEAHCCECGTTADGWYTQRLGYRRCQPCDQAHVRALNAASSMPAARPEHRAWNC